MILVIKLFAQLFSSPAIGSDWQTTYTFQSGASSQTLDLSNCTFRELSVPEVTISTDGRTISWNSVENATSYRLRWYPLKDGLPDTSNGHLEATGYIDATSYTNNSLTPGNYAVRVEACEFCSGNLVNRHLIYKKNTITDPTCDKCTGDPVVLPKVDYIDGTKCQCTATTSITIGTNGSVTIYDGAIVTFIAPTVTIGSDFKAEHGSVVNIKQE